MPALEDPPSCCLIPLPTIRRFCRAKEGRRNAVVAASLGIKRLVFERGYHGILGNATIVLSGGDGSVFTRWTVDCAAVTAADRLQCRAPDGCANPRLDGSSYCRRHHALFHVPFPPPSGRLLTITINKSGAMAVYLEVGTRSPADVTTCSDIDMMSSNADGRFVHKDGTPYPEP